MNAGPDHRGCDAGNGAFTCTLAPGHAGDHVAHGTYDEVCAIWSTEASTDVADR